MPNTNWTSHESFPRKERKTINDLTQKKKKKDQGGGDLLAAAGD
jgi:hypothetical protein